MPVRYNAFVSIAYYMYILCYMLSTRINYVDTIIHVYIQYIRSQPSILYSCIYRNKYSGGHVNTALHVELKTLS